MKKKLNCGFQVIFNTLKVLRAEHALRAESQNTSNRNGNYAIRL
jgi:hypothetical protein